MDSVSAVMRYPPSLFLHNAKTPPGGYHPVSVRDSGIALHDISLRRSIRFLLTHQLKHRVEARVCFFVLPELTPQAQNCMLPFCHETPDHQDDPDVYGTDAECCWGLGFAEVSE